VSNKILEELSQAMSKIDRPGTFCVSGSVQTVLPGLEVGGLGPIGLPLTGNQAKDLKKLCEQAPYGKGEKTLVDTSVRRVWRLMPSQFSLRNPDWKRFLEETLSNVQAELGLEKQKLESHLHELLLYEARSFFLPHRDGEKLDRMVATLVIVLPSSYEGGELIVRHEGQEQTIDFSSVENGALQTHFAAFYADCEHEVRPLRKGYRLCLVYNLTLAKSKKSITAPRDSEHIARIIPLLREWSEDDTIRKLAITLDHQYTKDGLAWDKLKGVDRVKARVLAEAARQVNCKAYLALLTFWESGSAEDDGGYGYGGHRRWYDEDEEDDDDGGLHEMGEVFESSLSAEHWSDSAGHSLPIGELSVEEDELLDPESIRDVKPEEEFEGYTGNAGMTLDRWYRHAAVILWPERKHFEVLCDDNSRKVVPVLEQMVARWQESKPKDAEADKSQCIGLATEILTKWPEDPHGRSHQSEGEKDNLLKILAALADPGLIGRFLGEVMIKDAAVDPGKSLVEVCQTYGWDTFRHELEALFKSTTIENVERNVRLLEEICLAKPRKKEAWTELCGTVSRDVVSALEAIDGEKASPGWRLSQLDRAQLLSGLARALSVTGQSELLWGVVSHALALPEKYPLRIAHLPALIGLGPWLEKNIKIPSSGLSRWVAVCREQLERLTSQAPREPTDFRREAAISCKCADCTELRRFLEDPSEAVHRFSMRQDRRSHLEEKIRQHKCDLDFTTERNRSPHTLVCTKNKASYQEELKTYRQDQQHLAAVLSIQESLPRSTT
jgi:2OG-Fe(II) oxygenase superfamily